MKKLAGRKHLSYIIAGSISAMLIISFLYFIIRSARSEKFPYYSVPEDTDSTLTIGIIGDSWVEDKGLDTLLNIMLLTDNISGKIISAFQGSARSKLVYQNLFKDKSDHHSSKYIIESRPDYCIVVAGVNDASGQVGPSCYSYHMSLIIKTLLHYNIKPVVITLPEFGIEEIPEDMTHLEGVLWKLRNNIAAFLNNRGEIDNIIKYREDLLNELRAENIIDQVTFVDFDNVCEDYYKCPCLYVDRGHLSKCGKQKLCRVVADKMIELIKTQQMNVSIVNSH